jgi:hypothetical protein
MNPLLETLEQFGANSNEGAHTITSLAFADNLILVVDDHTKAQELLTLTEQYFKKMGMTTAASKCASFQIKTTRDSWHMVDTPKCRRRGINLLNPCRLHYYVPWWTYIPLVGVTTQGPYRDATAGPTTPREYIPQTPPKT